ncbi:MAG: InlB B-repeat-containing protein, partial [Coriobacteriales bacterium]|nr:InlB B-repeat-containing protein [Coriobacteriales bacterium]
MSKKSIGSVRNATTIRPGRLLPKILSSFLAVFLALALLPYSSFAAFKTAFAGDGDDTISLTLTAGSGEKEYDGTALTVNTFTTYPALPGLFITVKTEGSQTEVGTSSNEIVPGSVKIMSNGEDVTNQIDVTLIPGTLTITQPSKTVELLGGDLEPLYSVAYDGNGGATEIVDSNEYEPDNTVTVIFDPTPVHEGFIFLGWA